MVGPNASFLRYIRDVLPALGEIDAQQTTIEELVATTLAGLQPKNAIRGEDAAAVATLKGDARMAEVLRAGAVVARRGADRGRWSCRAGRAAGGSRRTRPRRSSASLRARGVRYGAARAMLPQSLAHRILVKMELAGDSPDDRVQDAVARSKPVKDYANELWPAVDPARLVWRLLSEPDVPRGGRRRDPRAGRAGGAAVGEAAAGARLGALVAADAVLLDEAADLVERTPSLAHIVADEAQDLSPMMLRALARRSLDRVADRARRPGPGDHAVGDPLLGRGAGPPRQAGRPRRGAHPRLPGARRRDRVRRPAAAARSRPA